MGWPRVLAGDVPEGDVDGADGTCLGAAVAIGVDGGEHCVPVALDVEGALPQQQGGKLVVDEGADGARRVGGLAQPDQTVVGVDTQPERVRMAPEPDRLQAGDFHKGRWMAAISESGLEGNRSRQGTPGVFGRSIGV